MIPPVLGTTSKPDLTGVGLYSNAGTLLGITRARTEDGLADAWNGLKIDFDFPESRFTILSYEIYGGLRPTSTLEVVPGDGFTPENDAYFGLAGVAALGTFELTFFELDNFAADTLGTRILQPNENIYVTVRGVIDATPAAEIYTGWSEVVGLSLASKPTEGEYPNITPPPIFPWSRA